MKLEEVFQRYERVTIALRNGPLNYIAPIVCHCVREKSRMPPNEQASSNN